MSILELGQVYSIQKLISVLDKNTDNIVLYDCDNIFVIMVTSATFKKMVEDSPQLKITTEIIDHIPSQSDIEYFCIERLADYNKVIDPRSYKFDSTYVVKNEKTKFLENFM